MQNRILVPLAFGLLACLVPPGAVVRATAQATDASAAAMAAAPPAQIAGSEVTAAAVDYLAPYVSYPVASRPEAVAIGDLNHDGLNDVALVTSTSYYDAVNDFSVFVFLQNGSGTLRAPVRYPVGATSSTSPRSIDIGDLTGDGRNDVVVGRTGHSIVVLPQNTGGTLNPGVSYPTTSAHQVRIGDFNSDGRMDVATIASSRGNVAIFTQQTTGRLALAASYPAAHQGESDIEAGDVNGDGRDDLLITSGRTEGPDVSVLLQQPGGLFDTVRAYDWIVGDWPDGIAIGDMNSDGRNDVAFGYYRNVAYRLQKASGGFDPLTIVPSPSTSFGAGAEIGDLDSNLLADIVVAGSSRVVIHRQQAIGTLAAGDEVTIPSGTGTNPQGIAVGDVSGDGAADIVVVSYSSGLVVLVQTPSQAVPIGVSAAATGTGQIQVAWSPFSGATTYDVYRRGVGGAFTLVGSSATTSFLDAAVVPNTAYLYRVRARGPGGATGQSTSDLATSVAFSDDPIVPGTTPFRAAHLAELRAAVAAVRALAGLPALTFSADALPGEYVRASHLAELRTALDPALSALTLAAPPYADAISAGGLIKASHIEELRSRVR